MPFEINTKNLFLTYPKCDVPVNEAFGYFTVTYKPAKLLVAHEFHQDGTNHLHVFMLLDAPVRTKNAHYFDLHGSHGNYQGCRSPKHVLKYCRKGGDYKANFDVEAMLTAAKPDRAKIGGELLKKRPLTEVVEEYPSLIFGYNRLKLDVATYYEDLLSTKDPLYHWLPNPWGLLLSSRVRSKKRHYWLYSTQPNVGKTYLFAKPIASSCNAVIRSGTREPYWDVRPDTELIFLDEYNFAYFKFYELNAMCDGTYGFRRFSLGVLTLKNPLIIVLSNSSIDTIYPNMSNLLHARFKEIKLD